jgi:hypothetical protein
MSGNGPAALCIQKAWHRHVRDRRHFQIRDPQLVRLCKDFVQLNVLQLRQMSRQEAAMWMRVKAQGFKRTVPRLLKMVYRLGSATFGSTACAPTVSQMDGQAIFKLYLAITEQRPAEALAVLSAFHKVLMSLRGHLMLPECLPPHLLKEFMAAADGYASEPPPTSLIWSLEDEAEHQRLKYQYLRQQPPLQRMLMPISDGVNILVMLDCRHSISRDMSQSLEGLSHLLGTTQAQALIMQEVLPEKG